MKLLEGSNPSSDFLSLLFSLNLYGLRNLRFKHKNYDRQIQIQFFSLMNQNMAVHGL